MVRRIASSRHSLRENDILRGIILRQIKEQPSRDEAKKKLEEEIANLKIESGTLTQQLGVLGAPYSVSRPRKNPSLRSRWRFSQSLPPRRWT